MEGTVGVSPTAAIRASTCSTMVGLSARAAASIIAVSACSGAPSAVASSSRASACCASQRSNSGSARSACGRPGACHVCVRVGSLHVQDALNSGGHSLGGKVLRRQVK